MTAFYNNFLRLCAAKGVSESGAAKKIGLSNAAANGWKKGKIPSRTTQIKLAAFFDVSVEELMGDGIKKDLTENGEVDKETAELQEIWNSADEDEKRALLEMARLIKSRRK